MIYEHQRQAHLFRSRAVALGAEARSLRRHERKMKSRGDHDFRAPREEIRNALYYRRTHLLREEARALHLARAFLSGKPYKAIEGAGTKMPFPYADVVKIVQGIARVRTIPYDNRSKFSIVLEAISEWVAA